MRDYMVNQLHECGNRVLKSTVQVFYKAKPIGSGVLLCFNNQHFLISAAHVLEPEFIHHMTIPNGEELVQIQGKMVVTDVPVRTDDKIDLAIVKLSQECLDVLQRRFKFWTEENIDTDHECLASHQYMFCGYPIEKTEVDRMKIEISPVPLKVRTKITAKELINVPDYLKGSKWILDYQRGSMLNVNSNEREFSPHPKGVSGGGLWTIPCDPTIPIENTNVQLVGIMTDYFEGFDQVVCATNIQLVHKIILTKFQDT